MVECGAACLAMVLNYHGRPTSIAEVREFCDVGRDGLTAGDLVKAARQLNLRVRAVTIREDDFRFVPLPAIIHWEFNHFMVVERWSPKAVDVIDPAIGRRRMTAEEFDEGFTGVVMMLEPGVHFDRNPSGERSNLWTYMLNFIRQAPLALVQILGASLLLQLFGLALPVLTALIVDHLLPFHIQSALTLVCVGIAILVLAQLVTNFLRASILLYLQTRR
jgi:ABC-type bacteriocin/lantibiotic exporter with double-glycine peptidase domain